MNQSEQIKALAELDGWSEQETEESQFCYPGGLTLVKCLRWFQDFVSNPLMIGGVETNDLPRYLTSYDAIIPLIQKQPMEVKVTMRASFLPGRYQLDETPAQLCEALLRATGKWKD